VQGRELAVVGPLAARVVHLRRDHRALASTLAPGEPAPDDRLGEAAAVAVDVGGVEEVDAEVEGSVHDPVTLVLLGLRAASGLLHAEVHGAEAERADPEAGTAEQSVVHGR